MQIVTADGGNAASESAFREGNGHETDQLAYVAPNGIVLAVLSLVGLATLSGVGSAQTQGVPTNTGELRITGTAVVGSALDGDERHLDGVPHLVRLPVDTLSGVGWRVRCVELRRDRWRHDPEVRARQRRCRHAAARPGDRIERRRLEDVATNASAIVKDAGKLANTSPPTISGSATVGSTLTANRGTWSGADPITFSYTWRRCDTDGGSCSAISGANEQTYLLKAVDTGNTIRVRVAAKDSNGTSSATSVPTAVVTAATKPTPPASNGCSKTGGTVPVAGVSPPARLTIDQTQVSPSTLTFGTRSVTGRFHVSACGGSVEGALVYVTRCRTVSSRSERAGHWLRRLGDRAVHSAGRLHGQQQAAAARHVRPRPQERREPARRHLHPPARLVPRHTRMN